CPWEVAEPQLEKGTAPGRETLPGKEATKALEKGSRERESISEICPWESPDSKSSDKAEICPWEAAEPQLEKGAAPSKERLPGREVTKALEKSSRDRESVCPWESPDTEQPPAKAQTGSSALPK
ncbi:GP179 protein, partial [Gymnorhina tibicen]|nr:GP179 protein [Gymnorhina tibicen]